MLHVLALSVMAVVLRHPELLDQDPGSVLPTPLSEVDNVNIEISGPNLEVTMNDGSPIRPQPLLPHTYRDLWEHRTLSHRKNFYELH